MASKMTTEHIRRLKEELHKVQMQIRNLVGQEEALRLAISVVSDDVAIPDGSVAGAPTHGKRRRPIKDMVLRFVTENADRGLVAAEIVEMAASAGVHLDRNSVSSLLSKFKKEGVLDHEGRVYRPAKTTQKAADRIFKEVA